MYTYINTYTYMYFCIYEFINVTGYMTMNLENLEFVKKINAFLFLYSICDNNKQFTGQFPNSWQL